MNKSRANFITGETTRSPGNNRPLTILMTSTHPMTDINLCKTGHTIYNLDIQQFPIKWQREHSVPENMKIIKSINELPHRPDVILSQNIVDQFNTWVNLQFMFDCPIISFEHTLPTEGWLQQGIPERIVEDLRGVTRVFITEFSKNEWKCKDATNSHVIYHMVDTEKYNGWEGGNGRSMLLVNQFTGREWAVGNVDKLLTIDAANGHLIDLYGHNAGYNSRPLSNYEVVQKLKEYDVFINTSLRSPIPASLLEAAAVGIPILSTKTCAIPDFFKDGENIMFFETFEECVEKNKELLSNKKLRKQLGAAAREVVLASFNKDRYVADWNKVITEARKNYNE